LGIGRVFLTVKHFYRILEPKAPGVGGGYWLEQKPLPFRGAVVHVLSVEYKVIIKYIGKKGK
jgi:hypothetical protein